MKTNKIYTVLRIPQIFHEEMLSDLERVHPFAAERVGFFSTNVSEAGENFKIITVTGYHSVADEDYIDDQSVGAKISGKVVREAMQRIIRSDMGCLHVHIHDHKGRPGPSFTDLHSLPELTDAFYNANPTTASGYCIFSQDSFFCSAYLGKQKKAVEIDQLTIVGYPMHFVFPISKIHKQLSDVYSRQSFLGENAQELISSVTIGIVGLGGGGSHIAQQLAHLGIKNYQIFDGDHIESTNHNRLIGGWFSDIAKKLKKVFIAKRLITKINPKANVNVFPGRWQDYADELKKCDIVVGCVDTYDGRAQLEAACRRVLIPSIDIGMDVYKSINEELSISGQIILSIPGGPCLRCMRFITEEKLAIEAQKYGNTGGVPQVVWSNGVLASTGIGIIVDLITGWSDQKKKSFYLSYDGENGHLVNHPRLEYAPSQCVHYPLDKTGEPIFRKL